jgi:hypothetical protein
VSQQVVPPRLLEPAFLAQGVCERLEISPVGGDGVLGESTFDR